MVNRTEQLAKASKNLMLKEPFYGMFLIMLNKIWDNKSVPTACIASQIPKELMEDYKQGTMRADVGRNGINYNLILNEQFWDILQEGQKIGLLKHELLHIAFFHMTDFAYMSDRLIANIAQDIEINQYIEPDDLPPGPQLPETYPELNLEAKKGSDYYYQKLMNGKQQGNCPNLNAMLKACGTGVDMITLALDGKDTDVQVPDHSMREAFEQLDEATHKLIKNQTEHIIKEIADQVIKSQGVVPGEFAGILERLNKIEPQKFDWKGYLKRFAGGSQKIYTKKSRRKFSKRYPGNPGLKIKPKRHILFAIDTSGSVSNNELKECQNELYHILKTGTDITTIQCDSAISYVGLFSNKTDYKIHGRGGTNFQPVIDYYNEHKHKYTCLIYFTDGECSAPKNAKGRILWVLSSTSQDNKELPGQTIKLN